MTHAARLRLATALLAIVAGMGAMLSMTAASAAENAATAPAAQPHGHSAHAPFDDPAAYAKSWEDPGRDAWQRPAELVAALDVQPGMAVADIGTGTGYLLPHLSRAAGPDGRVFAVEVSAPMLEWVRERIARDGLGNVTTVLARADGTGLAPDSIDRAILINVWHHIEDQDAYARDLRQALRRGGVVFIVESRPDAEQPGGPPRHFRLQPDAVVTRLAQAGLDARLDPFEIDRQYVIRAERRRQ